MKIFTVSQMRAAEEETFKRGILPIRLMENAGAAFSKTLCELIDVKDKNICVVVGLGNNGGDGYVAARKLQSYGAKVSVIRAYSGKMTDSCTIMAKKCIEFGIHGSEFGTNEEYCKTIIQNSDIIIDAIFGIGYHGSADEYTTKIFKIINDSPATVVALDIPSGLSADKGTVQGEHINADITITLATAKYCHILPDASEYCGRVVCCSIGIPDEVMDMFGSVPETITKKDVAANLPHRKKNSHKGSFGTAMFLCGSYGMAGAAILACKAAIRSGVGKTVLATVKSIYPIVGAALPETVHLPLKETESGTISKADSSTYIKAAKGANAVCIGCGLGRQRYDFSIIEELFRNAECPIVLDADGINSAASSIDIFKHRNAALVITPHPAEMARLYNTTAKEVNANRIDFATRAAKDFGATVVLKGANTVVATDKGRVFVNMNGNPGMAKAGSGDMLSGIITALIAEGISTEAAACMGVYIHAAAGDIAAEDKSEYSMCVEDMISRLPQVFKSLK